MEVYPRCTCQDFKPVSATITFHSLEELEAFYAMMNVPFECVESNNEDIEIDYDAFNAVVNSLWGWTGDELVSFYDNESEETIN